jgi:hypothetical protein
MLTAISKVHGPNGFFMASRGFEYQFLNFFNCMALMIGGAGTYALFNRM